MEDIRQLYTGAEHCNLLIAKALLSMVPDDEPNLEELIELSGWVADFHFLASRIHIQNSDLFHS